MSDIEATAQPSAAAEETSHEEAPVSGNVITQNEPEAGSDEAINAINDVDSWRNAVDSLPASTQVEPAEKSKKTEGGIAPDEKPLDDAHIQTEEDKKSASQDADKKPPQYRWRPKSEVDALAMDIIKRAEKSGKEIEMKEALAKAESILQTDNEAPKNDNEDANNFPETVAESETLLKDLRTQRKQAFVQELDFEKAADLDEKIEAIKDHIASVKDADVVAQQNAVTEWNQTLEASKSHAVETYPDVTNADSELVKKMIEIDAQLEEDKNPLFHAPDKPFKLAQMAANEIGIAPKRPGSPNKVVSSQPAAKARPAQPAIAPMSGATRTTQPSNNGQFGVELDKVLDEDSWREAMSKLKVATA